MVGGHYYSFYVTLLLSGVVLCKAECETLEALEDRSKVTIRSKHGYDTQAILVGFRGSRSEKENK